MATNNVAEYNALIEGLQMALNAGVTDIDVHFDSPVLAGHLLKEHKVKADHLRPLIERVCQLLELFSTSSLVRVPRALNAHADKLANQGIEDAIGTPSAHLPNLSLTHRLGTPPCQGQQQRRTEHVIVEHLWSRAGATGGNRSQSGPPGNG